MAQDGAAEPNRTKSERPQDRDLAEAFRAPLFDDNPSEEDLLGHDAVADAVVAALLAGGLDPITVGVQGAWGGGKSTVLNLVAARLKPRADMLVVRVDPWEFEDSQDVRGTLINLVLNALQERVVAGPELVEHSRRAQVVERLQELRRRIAWGRVATVLVTSAVTLTPDLKGLVEALTPEPPPDPDAAGDGADTGQQGMAGFRQAFADLLAGELGVRKVVVLVDDLDRCLPAAVVSSLEAVKLFLSVKGMAFVLAADEDMVRASIDAHLGGVAGGEFAARYTEKIVQLPVSLPVLSPPDTEAYVALLLCRNRVQMTGADLRAVRERARTRRRAGQAPYVVPDPDGAPGPDAATMTLAATIGVGLSADRWGTPRAVKRFLNNLSVRQRLAADAGAELPLDVLVRLYVLELRHLQEFRALAAAEPQARARMLAAWDSWAAGDGDKPDGVSDATRAWAGTVPSLVGREDAIARYLSVTASLRSDVRFGGTADPAVRRLVEAMLSEAETVRRSGVQELAGLEGAAQDQVVEAVATALTRAEDAGPGLRSLVAAADEVPRLQEVVGARLRDPALLCRVRVPHVPRLEGFPDVLALLADSEDEEVAAAAAEHLPRA